MRIIFIFCSICFYLHSSAQSNKIDSIDLKKLMDYEDTISRLGDSIVQSNDWRIREEASAHIIPMVVKALKIKNSFEYKFDSLKTFSILNSEDQKFRIFTWQLTMKDFTYRYYGAIQMNTEELKLYPLIDMSLFIKDIEDTILDNNNWPGEIYYNIVQKKYKSENYYLLFGWDGNDKFSNKKMMDVLWFDEMGKPKFGMPVFYFSEDAKPKTRVIIEYKEDASTTFNFDETMGMIVFDYLVPENPLSEGIFMTYIPDGTYQGFKFEKGKWILVRNVSGENLDKAPYNPPRHEGENPNLYIKNQ